VSLVEVCGICLIAFLAAPIGCWVANGDRIGLGVWSVSFWLGWFTTSAVLPGKIINTSSAVVAFLVALSFATLAAFIYRARGRIMVHVRSVGFRFLRLLPTAKSAITDLSSSLRTRQFRLSTLLGVMVLAAAWFAYYASPTKRAERAASTLQSLGADVYFDYQQIGGNSYDPNATPPGRIIRNVIGSGPFQDADWVLLNGMDLEYSKFKQISELRSLRMLDAANCKLQLKHMQILKQVTSLENLIADGNNLGDSEISQLSRSKNLGTLSLSNNSVTGTGFRDYDTGKLRELFIYDNPITDDGLMQICQLSSLELLGINGEFTDAGTKHFENLKSLRYLSLNDVNIGDDTLKTLQKLPKLQTLEVHDTNVTRQGVAEFKMARPDCRIVH